MDLKTFLHFLPSSSLHLRPSHELGDLLPQPQSIYPCLFTSLPELTLSSKVVGSLTLSFTIFACCCLLSGWGTQTPFSSKFVVQKNIGECKSFFSLSRPRTGRAINGSKLFVGHATRKRSAIRTVEIFKIIRHIIQTFLNVWLIC